MLKFHYTVPLFSTRLFSTCLTCIHITNTVMSFCHPTLTQYLTAITSAPNTTTAPGTQGIRLHKCYSWKVSTHCQHYHWHMKSDITYLKASHAPILQNVVVHCTLYCHLVFLYLHTTPFGATVPNIVKDTVMLIIKCMVISTAFYGFLGTCTV